MRNGLVLAAGKSTRLSNKALMPMRNGRPVICSAIDFLLNNDCYNVEVIVSPKSMIQAAIRHLYPNLIWTVQSEPKGVVHAIQCAYKRPGSWLITFCDNIYPKGEKVPKSALNRASTRVIDSIELDGFDLTKWVDREKRPVAKLAGWVHLPYVHATIRGDRLIDMLNNFFVESMPMDDRGWHDIGTYPSYMEYLQ